MGCEEDEDADDDVSSVSRLALLGLFGLRGAPMLKGVMRRTGEGRFQRSEGSFSLFSISRALAS